MNWLEVLFDILELSLDVIIKRTCKKNEESQNGYHANGNEEPHTGIVEGLLSCKEQRQSSSKVQDVILRRIKVKSFLTKYRIFSQLTEM